MNKKFFEDILFKRFKKIYQMLTAVDLSLVARSVPAITTDTSVNVSLYIYILKTKKLPIACEDCPTSLDCSINITINCGKLLKITNTTEVIKVL